MYLTVAPARASAFGLRLRFSSRKPLPAIAIEIGDRSGSNPINNTDPSGLSFAVGFGLVGSLLGSAFRGFAQATRAQTVFNILEVTQTLLFFLLLGIAFRNRPQRIGLVIPPFEISGPPPPSRIEKFGFAVFVSVGTVQQPEGTQFQFRLDLRNPSQKVRVNIQVNPDGSIQGANVQFGINLPFLSRKPLYSFELAFRLVLPIYGLVPPQNVLQFLETYLRIGLEATFLYYGKFAITLFGSSGDFS